MPVCNYYCVADTLSSVPAAGEDPFIIDPESPPDVFFAGNQVGCRSLYSVLVYSLYAQ